MADMTQQIAAIARKSFPVRAHPIGAHNIDRTNPVEPERESHDSMRLSRNN
jgi:hypothetical protein